MISGTTTDSGENNSKKIARAAHLAKDPALFLKYAARTMDEADSEAVDAKPFPADLPYFEPLLAQWIAQKNVIVEKSRQLLVSWFYGALHLHYTFTQPNRKTLLLSTTEDKAKLLMDRCEYIYDNIPEDVWPSYLRPTKKRTATKMEFREINSMLISLPSSPETARSITASRVFLDEFAFMADVDEIYQGVLGSTAGGGIITIVSTNPVLKSETDCLFWRLCDGRMIDV